MRLGREPVPHVRRSPVARLAALVLLAVLGNVAEVGAISGEWGFTRQAYSVEDCAYVVFLRNELNEVINRVELTVQFFDAEETSLGIYELTADTWIQPWTTEMIDWKIEDVCGNAHRSTILKAVASY